MSQAVIFNSGRSPVKVSADGVILAGHDRATLDTDAPEVARAIKRGTLVVTDDEVEAGQSESPPESASA
jgi:hypothetical protein